MIRRAGRLLGALAALLLAAPLSAQLAPLSGAASPQTAALSDSVPWREVARGDVAVRYALGDSARAARLLARLLEQTPLPGLPPGVPSRAVAYLALDEASFHALTGGRIPDWGAGVAIPDRATIVIPAYASPRSAPGGEGAVVRHEWAHLGLHERLPGLQVPRWFDEGYARWAEGGFDASEAWRLRLLLALGRAPPLDSLSLAWPRDPASAEVAYLLAASAVAYLVEESGERGVALLLERWRERGSFDAALVATYGVTSGQLEEDWRAWVKRRFGWLLVLSNSVALWAVLGLGLAALGLGRRRRTRERMARLRAGEPGEEPAFWAEDEPPGP